MLVKVLILALVTFLLFLPSGATHASSQTETIWLGTDQGLFRSSKVQAQLHQVPGFESVSHTGYNSVAGILYIIHQAIPPGLENRVSVSHDLGVGWKTIKPSETGLKDPFGNPISSFGSFAVSDSGFFVADIGFGQIAVSNLQGNWQTIEAKSASSSLAVVGDKLYLLFAGEKHLTEISLSDPSRAVDFEVAGLNLQDNHQAVLPFGQKLLVSGRNSFTLIDPQTHSSVASLEGILGLTFLSNQGIVVTGSQGVGQVYDLNLGLVENFQTHPEDLAYQHLGNCLLVIRTDSVVCGNQAYSLPRPLLLSAGTFVTAVSVPNDQPQPSPPPKKPTLPDPALFVSGLGGGQDGSLWWEGKDPEKVTLVTASGLEFFLTHSVWATGQQGYFLTFSDFFTNDICFIAEIVGRSVDYIRLRTGADKIDLIGYSMGGLMARCFVEGLVKSYPYDNSIDDLLLLAVPNNGSFAAGLAGPLIIVADVFKGWQASSLSPHSGVVKALNRSPIPNSVSVTVMYGTGFWLPIIGRNDGLVSDQDAKLQSSVQKSVTYINLHKAVHSDQFSLGDDRYSIIRDRIHLVDTIRLMGENKNR